MSWKDVYLKKHILFNLIFMLSGVTVAVFWIYFAGGPKIFRNLNHIHPLYIAILLGVMIYFIALRFIRWQYLLRRAEIRLPIRPSLSIYLASLIGLATPAYIGELLIRCIFLQKRFDVRKRDTTWVWLVDRLFDFIALGLIGILTVFNWWSFAICGFFVIAALVLVLLGGEIMLRSGVSPAVVFGLKERMAIIQALILSLLAWIPAALLVSIAAAGIDVKLAGREALNIFSVATLLGGLSLSPAGVGVTGSFMILMLQSLSIDVTSSILIVTIFRSFSTALAMIVGMIFLYREIRNWGTTPVAQNHFNDIADAYRAQFTDHIWAHLIDRKSCMLSSIIISFGLESGVGLDLGCGLGYQSHEMAKRRFNVLGLDSAYALLQHARKLDVSAANGDALRLPFATGSLDYVYTIGVLHHLPGETEQRLAGSEVLRALKPGGVFIVQETNPYNPVFRFYMGYIFPLLRSIDEGTEHWISPRFWHQLDGFETVNETYFTFIPDFIPSKLSGLFFRIEKILENSIFRSQSVHYMAVLKKNSVDKFTASAEYQPELLPHQVNTQIC